MPTKTKPKAESRGRSKSPARYRGPNTRSRSRSRGRSPPREPEPVVDLVRIPLKTKSKTSSRSRSPGRRMRKEIGQGDVLAKHEDVKVEKTVMSATKSASSSKVVTQTVSSRIFQSASTSNSSSSSSSSSMGGIMHRHSARIAVKQLKETEADDDEVDATFKNNVEKKEVKSTITKEKKVYAMGGPFVTFILCFVFPAIFLIMAYGCTKEACTLVSLMNVKQYLLVPFNNFFDTKVLLMTGGWFVTVSALSLVPAGKLVEGPPLANGKKQFFRCNGAFIHLVVIAAMAMMWYKGLPVSLPYTKFPQFVVSLILMALIWAVLQHVIAVIYGTRQANPDAYTGCWTHDFAIGRDIFPALFGGHLQFKLVFMRLGMLSMCILDLAMLASVFNKPSQLNTIVLMENYPLVVMIVMHLMYFGGYAFGEAEILLSWDMRKESFGFINSVGILAGFSIYNITARYVLEHPKDIWRNYYWTGFCVVIFLIGLYIMLVSNYEKADFRKNPTSTKYARIVGESRDLLVGGFWGVVRKPNYLGDIMATASWALLCGFKSVVPYFHLIFVLLILVDRVNKDNAWCREKHGKTWDIYCHRVKYKLLPYVW